MTLYILLTINTDPAKEYITMPKHPLLYGESLALLTDLYQLTMAYGYWQTDYAEKEAEFTLYFRHLPFKGGYAIAAGIAPALEFIKSLQFTDSDIHYLASLTGQDNQPLFSVEFLDYLAALRFDVDIDAVPEGSVIFAHEPLLRIRGRLLVCQLLETALLTIVNFQTLIASKAARVCQAAQGDSVLEFGLRRAQGIDGGISASRAAYIGGCAATSNVLAGKLHGIPVKGTHAHSWVMAFEDELTAFRRYADSLPNNCTFLVDTYDTHTGTENAITIAQELREKGHQLQGVRLDSGDLNQLSQQTRQQLDEAGLADVPIIASNDLDEYTISALKAAGAKISVWGVGTKLITSYDQPALGGVYKLHALRDSADTPWDYKIKISADATKTTLTGQLQIRRFYDPHTQYYIGDILYDINHTPCLTAHTLAEGEAQHFPETANYTDLLQAVMRDGDILPDVLPKLADIRDYAQQQQQMLQPSLTTLISTASYPVLLEAQCYHIRQQLILQTRNVGNAL